MGSNCQTVGRIVASFVTLKLLTFLLKEEFSLRPLVHLQYWRSVLVWYFLVRR